MAVHAASAERGTGVVKAVAGIGDGTKSGCNGRWLALGTMV
jgi:hypothetical protein